MVNGFGRAKSPLINMLSGCGIVWAARCDHLGPDVGVVVHHAGVVHECSLNRNGPTDSRPYRSSHIATLFTTLAIQRFGARC